MIITNNTATPKNGNVRLGQDYPHFDFKPWEEKELPDELALKLYRMFPKRFRLSGSMNESDTVLELKDQLRREKATAQRWYRRYKSLLKKTGTVDPFEEDDG